MFSLDKILHFIRYAWGSVLSKFGGFFFYFLGFGLITELMKFIFIILLSFLPLSLFSEFIMSYSEINGQYEGDFFGKNLSLNSDGTVLAVGSGNRFPYNSFFGEGGPRYDDTTFSNDVNVYELSDGSWIQKGDPITIDYPGFWSYSNVSISDNGQVLAIGNYNHDIGTSASVVRVFEWSGTSWTQKGNDIINRGHFVVVSKDASTVSIGSSDHISVFEWSGIDWAQKGSDIEALSDTGLVNEGLCITLSNDGNTIGIGDKYAEIEAGYRDNQAPPASDEHREHSGETPIGSLPRMPDGSPPFHLPVVPPRRPRKDGEGL